MRSFRSLSAQTGMMGWLWLSAVVIVMDQLAKWQAEANLELGATCGCFSAFEYDPIV